VGKPGRLVGELAVLAVVAAVLPASAAADVPGYPVVSSGFNVGEGNQGTEDVQCPGAGDIAISGGISSPVPLQEQMWLKSSRPGDLDDPGEEDSWTVEVQNVFDGIETTSPTEVFAVCDDSGASEDKVRSTKGVKVRNHRQVNAFPKCRDGEAVVGGGADVPGGIGEAVFLSTSAPRDDSDRDRRPDGWYVVAEVQGIDGTTTMDAYAVCDRKRGPKKYAYRTDEVDVADGDQRFAVGICNFPEERRVGGGARSHSNYGQALRINTSAPSADTGWETVVDNLSSPDDDVRKITATAICRKS
jgi:hypothetical protein